MRQKKDIRIFFALWPDAAVREHLAALARRMPVERPARRVPDYNLHLTLHFIGNVFFDQLDCLQRQARKVSGRPFELQIDDHGVFRKARVGWLGCKNQPPELARLHGELGEHLRPCGYRVESRPYNPHVTVARKMNRLPAMSGFEPLRWKVDSFVLIESREIETGVKYEIIETYPLK